MYSANPPSGPANFTSPPPSPTKATTQKLYREKEAECIDTLRGVIKRLTGEELQTRYEILRKVIDLLSSVLEMRRREQARVGPSVQYQVPVTASNPVDHPSAPSHLDYPPQSHLQPWPNAENVYYMQAGQPSAGGQQYPMPNLYGDSSFEQAGYQGLDYQELGEHWHDPQF